jgi:type II secretory pathway component PulJ
MKINKKNYSAFTLIEAVMAVAILAAITTSVLVVMNRCVTAAIDIRIKMQAFEIARENMEKLLASASLSDMTEFGYSEQNPDIEWQTAVQSFYEPVTSRMWMEAVCSATYYDSKNEQQKVELTHWLTDLTKEQILKILDQQTREAEFMDQTQYEEYITKIQDLTTQYLEELGLDVDAYAEFIEQQQQERLDWLDENEYNKEDYNEFTLLQREEEEQVLTDLGVNLDDMETWLNDQPDYKPLPKPSTSDPSILEPSDSPDSTPSPSQEIGKPYTADDLRNMGVPEAWIPLFLKVMNQ